MSLPNFPNPSAKDDNGKLLYGTHESLMIEYYKQYGVAEAVRKINQFMNSQEQIVLDITRRINDREQQF